MRNIRALIARVLVVCMVFNLMVPALSVYAETAPLASETAAVDSGKDQVKDAQSSSESGQATLDQNAKDKAAQSGKTLSTSTGTDVNTAINQSAADQKKLDDSGKTMEKIGNIMKTVGTALIALGTALSAIPYTAAIGKIMVTVGNIVKTIGETLISTGKADQGGATKASTADKNLVNDSTKASTVTTTTTTTQTTVDSKAVFTDTTAGSPETTTESTTAPRGTDTPAGADD